AAARKQWIAGRRRPAGAISIDAGAERALLDGRSLLPAGVTGARGRFDRGDTVSVLAADGAEIARGIVAYSDVDAARIMGRKSSEIAAILGFRGRDEMIHRDDPVLMRPELSQAAAAEPAAQPSPRGAMNADQIGELMEGLGKAATAAAQVLALASTDQKNSALRAAAAAVRARRAAILAANERDMSAARAARLSGPRLERLRLDERRIEAIAESIDAVIELRDPIGSASAE